MSINKFEKFILDHIGIERGRKLLLKIEGLVHKYKNYRISQELEAKRDVAIVKFPESHRQMAKTLLDNQIKSLLGPSWTPTPLTSEQMHMMLDSAIKSIGAYTVLSNIVGVQPLKGPVDNIYLLQYADNGEGISLCFNTVPSNAETTKFRASMRMEAIYDKSVTHGLDIKRELSNALGSEFGSEIVSNTLRYLVSIAKETVVSYVPSDDADIAKLAFIEFNKAAADIAHKTRRGAGNFLVMNPGSFIDFSMDSIGWEPATSETTLDTYNLVYAGKLGDKYSVYLTASIPVGKVLVGYAGATRSNQFSATSVDVGVTVTPYIPVISTGVMVNPDTYEPIVTFLNRSGLVPNDLSSEQFEQKAENYYRIVDITTLLAH